MSRRKPLRNCHRRYGLPIPRCARDLFTYWREYPFRSGCDVRGSRSIVGTRPFSSIRTRRLTTGSLAIEEGYLDSARSHLILPRTGSCPTRSTVASPNSFSFSIPLTSSAGRCRSRKMAFRMVSRFEVIVGRGNYFNRGNLTRLQHGRIVAQTVVDPGVAAPGMVRVSDREEIRFNLKASLPPFESGDRARTAHQRDGRSGGQAARSLAGASYVVDAASASSLVALDLGAKAHWPKKGPTLSLVGGVYLEADVDFPLVFQPTRGNVTIGPSRSPSPATPMGCFRVKASAVVVLKRRSRCCCAMVTGSMPLIQGRWRSPATAGGLGLTSPSARGHARAIRRAYRSSGIDPATVGFDRRAWPGRSCRR